jgi:hypothetical protein
LSAQILRYYHLLVNRFFLRTYCFTTICNLSLIYFAVSSSVSFTVSAGIISGPFKDDKSSDLNIFGRSERKRDVIRAPSYESFLAKTTDTTVSLSGAEVASRAVFLGHICSDLQKIVVVLNFSSSTWPSKKSPHSSSISYLDPYATPSNLELTIGTVTMRTFLRTDFAIINAKFPS